MKVNLANFIVFKNVMDAGAEIPAAPCNVPLIKPTDGPKFRAVSNGKIQSGFNLRNIK